MGFDMITLVLFKDESVSWIQRGKATPSWTREESLKSISTIQLIDLPTDQSTNIDPYNWSFTQRLSIQVQLLRSYLSTLLAEIETGAFFQPKTRDPLINEYGLIRDQFNLHKIIFVVTKSGNAHGLDSLDGDVIWKVSLDEFLQLIPDTPITTEAVPGLCNHNSQPTNSILYWIPYLHLDDRRGYQRRS